MAENLRKLLIYFLSRNSYWRVSDATQALTIGTGPITLYPIDLIRRLETGHFQDFDAEGLPVRPARQKAGVVHNYTTISAFALAHWDRYLLRGDRSDLHVLLKVADYVLRTGHRSTDRTLLRLRLELAGKGHVGPMSAMFQGEAASVLCRAYQATRDPNYLEAAWALLRLYDVRVNKGGVLGFVKNAGGVPWYEEATQSPHCHVLNGMAYAVFGAHDLALTTQDDRAIGWFDQGVASIEKALPLFDTGYWSWYFIAEAESNYIASMMYHNLHIRQLRALARLRKSTTLEAFALRFEHYAGHFANRARAGWEIFKAKAGLPSRQ